MTKRISFFEGSYQFKQETTNLNVSPDFIQKVLALQYEYRPTTEDLWAEVSENGQNIVRYQFNYQTGLTKLN